MVAGRPVRGTVRVVDFTSGWTEIVARGIYSYGLGYTDAYFAARADQFAARNLNPQQIAARPR